MKLNKKIIGMLTVMLLFIGCFLISGESKGATLFDGAITWEPYKLMNIETGSIYKFVFDTKQTVRFYHEGSRDSSATRGTLYDDNGIIVDDWITIADDCEYTFDAGTYYYRIDNKGTELGIVWYTLSNPSVINGMMNPGTAYEAATPLAPLELYNNNDDEYVYKRIDLLEAKKINVIFDKGYYIYLFDSNGLEVANHTNLLPGTYFLRLRGNSQNLYYSLTDYDKATAVSLSKTSATLSLGQTIQLGYFLTPSNCTDTVTWSSGNDKVAKVDKNGVVTAVGGGECLIIATSSSKKSAACKITVQQPTYVKSIALKKSKLTLKKGKSYNLLSNVTPSNATIKTLKWESSNANCVSVTGTGSIKAKKTGVATITATSTDGTNVKASCVVIVKPGKATIKKCKVDNGLHITVNVKSQEGVTGYQYQLCRKKNFKSKKSSFYTSGTAATTAILSKKKTYYVRVRSYIERDGVKSYGAWSKVKKAKTKSKGGSYGYFLWKKV